MYLLQILFTSSYIMCCYTETINYTIAVMFEVGNGLSFDIKMSRPAIDLGLETLNNMVGHRLNLKVIDIQVELGYRQCIPNGFETMAARLYHVDEINGIIGPACSYIVKFVGLLASGWNIPMLTPIGSSSVNSNKTVFKTLTRLAHNNGKFMVFYLTVLRHFNWTDVALIYDNTDYVSWLFGHDVIRSFPPGNIQLSVFTVDSTMSSEMLRETLKTASKSVRVFYIKCNGKEFRDLMVEAHKLGMTNGEYVFVYLRLFDGDTTGNMSWKRGYDSDLLALQAYEAVLVIQIRVPPGSKFQAFDQEVKKRAKNEYNYDWGDTPVNIFITAGHDMFALYGTALNEILDAGEDPINSSNVMKRMWGRTFEGAAGPVTVDPHGDRDVDFSLMDFDSETGLFREVYHYIGSTHDYLENIGVTIKWPNNYGPPPNRPKCGFQGEAPECADQSFPVYGLIAIILGIVFLLVAVVVGVIYRKMRLEFILQSEWWKVRWTQVTFQYGVESQIRSRATIIESYQMQSIHSHNQGVVGMFKGIFITIKALEVKRLNIDRESIMELMQMRDCNHPHLAKFYGLCTEEPHICILSEYCSRGSLQSILQNDSIKLDRPFKISLTNDIVQGMTYIHQGALQVHGRLSSSACLIDSRFSLKITDFGLQSIYRQEMIDDTENTMDLLWVAPEHMRTNPRTSTSQRGDIYSFGMILYEVISRVDPFDEELNTMPVSEIIRRVCNTSLTPFRPRIGDQFDEIAIIDLMKKCWTEDPLQRPLFSECKRMLQKADWYVPGGNMFDVLMTRMEQYADNLEKLVEERTCAFLVEKDKSEQLLYHILPRSVAETLKNGRSVDPEAYESVTIYLSDIVGFTAISAASSPKQVVDLLNKLYTSFDVILEQFDVYKVETIGDAYMVVSGLPVRNGIEHARQIARMSLSILSFISHFEIEERPDVNLNIRIGLHSGFVCAGVVGKKMPRYCLFGDTVNTAYQMESSGEAMRIHISFESMTILDQFGSFMMEKREVVIKGKNDRTMETFWLLSEESKF